MKTIKRSYSVVRVWGAMAAVFICSILSISPPVWAQEAVNQRTVQALNQKLDVLINALSRSGEVHFTDSMKDELCRLSREISSNTPQALICGAPHQALIRSPEAPPQALIRSPDSPQQALIRSPDAPQQALIRGGNS